MEIDAAAARKDKAFLGHPIGLAWLSASEFWERFAYYGAYPLIALYLTQYLLDPKHVEHVIGYPALKAVIKFIYGANLTPEQIGIAISNDYAALVYLTPILGGLIADRLIGRTPAVITGALLMMIGQFSMALDSGFVIGLVLLICGVGFFKGNIASQVGDLYSAQDKRRADAFLIYFMGIQLAAIVTPLVCGTLAEKVDWHLGFVAAGAGMTLGLIIYLMGRKNYPPEPLRRKADAAAPKPKLTGRDWSVIVLLVALLPVLALSIIGNQEIPGAYLIWGKSTFQTTLFGFSMPITWLVSVDAIVSAVLMGLVIMFWRWWSRHWTEPTELAKIIIGTAISALAPLLLAGAAAQFAATGKPVSLIWAVGFHVVNDLGFSIALPMGLALYSRAAPRGLGGAMISTYYLSLFLCGMLISVIGGWIATMPATKFWVLHAVLIAIAAAVLIVVRLLFGRLLAPAVESTQTV
jgi:POT family proton-dependent oligopeptide transporter